MIGLAIGRIGDVINGEHHGTPTTLPWGVEYVNPDTLGQPGQIVHPEVAYEMILTLVLLGAILPFHRRLKARLPDGVLGLAYLGLYAIGRFFLSYFRTDPAVFAGLRQAQLASLLMVAIAVIAIPILFQRRRSAAVEVVEAPMVVEPVEAPAEMKAVEPDEAVAGAIQPEPAEPLPPAPTPPRKPGPRRPGAPGAGPATPTDLANR
jgi:hypothetical protein